MTKTINGNKAIITSYTQVSNLVEEYRKLGKRICLTQGSFDMLHIGHGRYLKKAKDEADILIVGVDSDEKIRQRKGNDRPVVPQEERMEMLAYLRSVDHVVLKPLKAKKWELIKLIKPDVLVATQATYSGLDVNKLQEFCGEIKVFTPQATTSTSAKLRRLQIGFAHNFSSILTQKINEAIKSTLIDMKS